MLPDLKYDFSDALVTGVRIGPRREVTITILIVEWTGNRGHYGPDKQIRFGGIVNFEEIQEFFTKHLQPKNPNLALAWIKFDESQNSKPGNLFIKLACEMIDDQFTIHCSNVQVS